MTLDNLNSDIDNKITLADAFNTFWINKIFIILFTVTIALISLIYSLTLPNIYTSSTLLVPTSLNNNSMSQGPYSTSLIDLAGLNMSGSKPDVDVAVAFINSKRLVSELIKNESFLPNLIAAQSWDMKTNTIVYDEKLYDKKNKSWVRKVNPPYKKTPSAQEAFTRLKGHIQLKNDTKKQFVTLSIDHISPVIAREWSLWIIQEANSMVADIRVKEAQDSIDYLKGQVKISPYAELNSMFYTVIQQKTQSMMLAKVNPEYALTTIDPPLVSEYKSKPQRKFICILGTLFGGIISLVIIMVRRYFFNIKDELNLTNYRVWLSRFNS